MFEKSPSFSVISLGCARTLVDTEKMVDQLQLAGLQLTAEGTGEKVTILNTCSFIQSAIEETEQNINQLLDKKRAGDLKHVVVAGCYPSRFKEKELQARFPDVDLWVTTKEEAQIQQKITQLLFMKKFQPTQKQAYIKLTPSHFAYLKISEGCDNWCTFCTIPKIRGAHNSFSIENIIKECQLQQSFGAKELIVLAEDTTAWGEDIYGKPSLPVLLEEMAKLPVDWIRNMYIYPSRVDDALINVIRRHDNICNYMDMPIQHVSTRMLDRMRRRHDKDFLLSIMDKLFTEIPDFTWRTTFIVGFPGETEDDVDEIIDFIERYPVMQLGCFPYSEERETRAARMDGKVAPDVIQARIKRIMQRQFELVQDRHVNLVGEKLRVLYEGNGEARSYREAPEVDGKIIIADSSQLSPGQFYNVQTIGHKGYDLQAILI
jgi:ribosomal protein S12 methylthiotransferase